MQLEEVVSGIKYQPYLATYIMGQELMNEGLPISRCDPSTNVLGTRLGHSSSAASLWWCLSSRSIYFGLCHVYRALMGVSITRGTVVEI